MQQRKITHADPQQIAQRSFEEDFDATRVMIVGAQMPELKLGDIKLPEFQTIEVPVVVKEIEYREIEKPIVVIQKELQIEKVEVPTLILQKEIQFEKVEIPVIIEKPEIKIIEKPVIIKETEYKNLPKGVMLCLAVQAITSIILLLKMILK